MMRNFMAAVALAFALALPSLAHAKGPMLFNTGEELFEVAEFPAEIAKDFSIAEFKLGYKCDRFGIFWADVWTWNCQQVAVHNSLESYADLPDEIKTKFGQQYTMSDAKRGLWNKYGFWAALVVLLAVIGFGALGGKKDTAED